MSVSQSDLRDALFNIGSEADDAEVVTDYSGRGMYGDTCLAIIAPDMSIVTQAVVNLADYDQEGANALASAQQLDSMGLGVVAYYPGVEFTD